MGSWSSSLIPTSGQLSESEEKYLSLRVKQLISGSPRLGMLRNPSAPAPSHCTVQGVYLPLQGMHGWGKDCLRLIPFKMLQISSFTLSLKCFSSDPDSCPNGGIGPLLQSPHPPKAGPVLLTRFSPQFLHPAEFCVGLYILSRWSGPPVHSQMVFCMHFCVWSCVPDVSLERDVLHVHLLLCHLVLFSHYFGFDGILIRNNYPEVIVIPRETFVQIQNLL